MENKKNHIRRHHPVRIVSHKGELNPDKKRVINTCDGVRINFPPRPSEPIPDGPIESLIEKIEETLKEERALLEPPSLLERLRKKIFRR